MAHAVVGPELTDSALVPGPGRARLEQVVREHVLGPTVVRVKVWDERGTVVYSDDAALIGQTFPLPADERQVLTGDAPAQAEVSDLDEAENVGEQEFERLLQVYRRRPDRRRPPAAVRDLPALRRGSGAEPADVAETRCRC